MHTKDKYPIQIYVKEKVVNNDLVYSYTFNKNVLLFKWLLDLQYLKFDKVLKLLYSDAKVEILERIEIASKGKIKFNKFHIQKPYVTESQNNVAVTIPRIVIPKHDIKIKILVKTAVYESKNYFILTTDHINDCKRIFENSNFVTYNRRMSAFLIPQ